MTARQYAERFIQAHQDKGELPKCRPPGLPALSRPINRPRSQNEQGVGAQHFVARCF